MSLKKKKVSNHIAPHRPPTLAVFPPWGSSEGAGRMALTDCKSTFIQPNNQLLMTYSSVAGRG